MGWAVLTGRVLDLALQTQHEDPWFTSRGCSTRHALGALQVHPGGPSPSLYRNQRSHRAADPSQNQPGAEAAGSNAVQFLNLFVTWATSSCWRIREGSEYTGADQQPQHFWKFTLLHPTQGCSAGPHSQGVGLGWGDIKSSSQASQHQTALKT